jgi:NAD(P)-dependent dehydrogenase (short-subunit alcohol dehydrogenase family)
MPRLAGRVAVVTGASRGGGRGIALALGQEGATVYVTGRSIRGERTTGGLPGTIDETAEQVAAQGGVSIAVRCDHTDDDQVAALFHRVATEQGRLNILVNNAWGGYEDYGSDQTFDALLWYRWHLAGCVPRPCCGISTPTNRTGAQSPSSGKLNR